MESLGQYVSSGMERKLFLILLRKTLCQFTLLGAETCSLNRWIEERREDWHSSVNDPSNPCGTDCKEAHIVMSKITATFRSESASQNYHYIAPLSSTRRLQNKNMFDKIDSILRKELCKFG